jgi:hypothetical protein
VQERVTKWVSCTVVLVQNELVSDTSATRVLVLETRHDLRPDNRSDGDDQLRELSIMVLALVAGAGFSASRRVHMICSAVWRLFAIT